MATTCTIKLGSLVPSKLGSLVPSTTASHSSPNTPTVSKALLARFFPEHGGVRRRAAQAHAALYRYSLIRPLADPGLSPVERSRLVRELAAQVHLGPSGQPVTAFGRFQADEPDELCVSDGLHGPIVEGKRAVLFALLDDCSRYVVGHWWGHGEDTWACRPRCTTRSKTTAARGGCTPTMAARTPPNSSPGRRRCSTSRWCTANPENPS